MGCSKRATNWFVTKHCPSTKEVKGIKINLDFIFNNFPVHRTSLRLVYIYSCSLNLIYTNGDNFHKIPHNFKISQFLNHLSLCDQ